jgi:hypothetical protein
MAIITPATTIEFGRFGFGQRRSDLAEVSETTGAANIRLLGPPRWKLSVESPRMLSPAQVAIWQPLVLNLRGRVNHLAMWDAGQPAPLGTMRGTLTVSGTPAAGATSVTITGGVGQAGTTLKANDWLQFGTGLTSQLVNVTADATANGSGVITVTFEPPLRIALTNGSAVTWDRPVAHYKVVNDSFQLNYEPGFLVKGSVALDLLEQWT